MHIRDYHPLSYTPRSISNHVSAILLCSDRKPAQQSTWSPSDYEQIVVLALLIACSSTQKYAAPHTRKSQSPTHLFPSHLHHRYLTAEPNNSQVLAAGFLQNTIPGSRMLPAAVRPEILRPCLHLLATFKEKMHTCAISLYPSHLRFCKPSRCLRVSVSPYAQPLSNSTRPHTPPAHGSTRSRKRKKPANSTHPEPATPQGECRAANGEAGLLGPPPGPENARQLPARCGRWLLVIIVYMRGGSNPFGRKCGSHAAGGSCITVRVRGGAVAQDGQRE